MTIKGQWDVISNDYIECMMNMVQTAFAGYRISIDMMAFSFVMMMSARSKVARNWNVAAAPVSQEAINTLFYRMFMTKVIALLEKGITPIFVFETGRHRLKQRVDVERAKEREDTANKIHNLRMEISRDLFSADSKNKIEELRRLESNLKSFPSEVKDNVFDLLFNLGIPCIRCKEGVEAERVASILCMTGIAVAVYSTDGDCLCHGAPIQIRSEGDIIYEDGFGQNSFLVVDRESLIELMNITSEQFTDIGICAGCDYNTNMYKIGYKRSLALIRKHGCVTNFPDTLDYSCLNYEECIKEFGIDNVKTLISDECLEYYGVSDWNDFSCCQVAKDRELQDYGLENLNDSYMKAVDILPKASNYQHKVIEMITTDDNDMQRVLINFPQGLTSPYVKQKKKIQRRAPSTKSPVKPSAESSVKPLSKINVIRRDVEDLDDLEYM